MPSSESLRYAAKAIIIENGRILCLQKEGDIGRFYVLPGGGQNPGELLTQALVRECREELGADVHVGRLRHVQEYIGDNHNFRDVHRSRHFVNVYFDCVLLERPETHPIEPDQGQVALVWLEVSQLLEHNFYPRVLAQELSGGPLSPQPGADPIYLGDSI